MRASAPHEVGPSLDCVAVGSIVVLLSAFFEAARFTKRSIFVARTSSGRSSSGGLPPSSRLLPPEVSACNYRGSAALFDDSAECRTDEQRRTNERTNGRPAGRWPAAEAEGTTKRCRTERPPYVHTFARKRDTAITEWICACVRCHYDDCDDDDDDDDHDKDMDTHHTADYIEERKTEPYR